MVKPPTVICRAMNTSHPCSSLLDSRLRLPLEQSIIPRLSAEALGCLASTCKALHELLYSEWLDDEWWLELAANKLGPQHPALLGEPELHSPSLLRAAMSQCACASARLMGGQYTQSESRLHPALAGAPKLCGEVREVQACCWLQNENIAESAGCVSALAASFMAMPASMSASELPGNNVWEHSFSTC